MMWRPPHHRALGPGRTVVVSPEEVNQWTDTAAQLLGQARLTPRPRRPWASARSPAVSGGCGARGIPSVPGSHRHTARKDPGAVVLITTTLGSRVEGCPASSPQLRKNPQTCPVTDSAPGTVSPGLSDGTTCATCEPASLVRGSIVPGRKDLSRPARFCDILRPLGGSRHRSSEGPWEGSFRSRNLHGTPTSMNRRLDMHAQVSGRRAYA
jgi:hypothetical protein